jgi:tetratricopeptide (TPR) repeat protein
MSKRKSDSEPESQTKRSRPEIPEFEKTLFMPSPGVRTSLNDIHESGSPMALRIVKACSFFYPDGIPERFFARQCSALGLESEEAVQDAIDAAVDSSLVKRKWIYKGGVESDPMNFTLAINQETHMYFCDLLERGEKIDWGSAIVTALDNEVNSDEHYKIYTPHILQLLNRVDWQQLEPQAQAHFGGLLIRIGTYLYHSGILQESEEFLHNGEFIIDESDHLSTVAARNLLASLYTEQEKYDEAEWLYKRVVEIHEETLGPDHLDTAASLANLANFYSHDKDRQRDAEPPYQRAIAIRDKALGPEHPSTATLLTELAELHESLGKYDQAEPLYERALAIREKVLGPEHCDTAMSLNNLAVLKRRQGQKDQAEPLFKRMLAIDEKKELYTDDQDMAVALRNLAGFCQGQGKNEKAEALFQRSLAIHEKVLGDDIDTAYSLQYLADFYKDQGKYDEAKKFYQRGLTMFESVWHCCIGTKNCRDGLAYLQENHVC